MALGRRTSERRRVGSSARATFSSSLRGAPCAASASRASRSSRDRRGAGRDQSLPTPAQRVPDTAALSHWSRAYRLAFPVDELAADGVIAAPGRRRELTARPFDIARPIRLAMPKRGQRESKK